MSSLTVHDQGHKAPVSLGDGRRLRDVTDEEIIRAVRHAQERIEESVANRQPNKPWPSWPR